MNFDFREHDRAVAMSNEQERLDTALSRLHKAQQADMTARKELQQVRSTPTFGLDNHEQRLHRDRFAELQRVADECEHELSDATFVADRLRGMLHRQKLEGRVEVHRRLTANIIGAVVTLRDAVAADRQFRDRLKADMLRFDPPLQPMADYVRGGAGWVDRMLPVIEAWRKEMQRANPYHLVAKAKQPQIA